MTVIMFLDERGTEQFTRSSRMQDAAGSGLLQGVFFSLRERDVRTHGCERCLCGTMFPVGNCVPKHVQCFMEFHRAAGSVQL